MAGASEIRAGAAFIEIRADDTKFQSAVKSVHNRLALLGQSLRRVGTQLASAGAALGVPILIAARHAATFEDAMLELQASVSDISPDQLRRVRDEAVSMSKALGVAPELVAQAFALLVKAGMSVEDALNGAAKTAVEFARVSGVSAQDAATFMKVAMNVFGGSAASAADTLSAAADASETDIRHMVEAFGLVGSAGKAFDQTLFDISQGFAVLAKYGIQGEEAGTGIKVMLQRLIAPSSEAQKALNRVGFSIENFRDKKGRMLPIVQIVDILATRLAKVDKITRDQVLDQVFGDRGVRVVGAFLDMGKAGFDELADAMEHNLPVSEKFRIVMSGLTGLGERLLASLKRLALALASSLGPGLRTVANGLATVADTITALLTTFPVLGRVFGVVAAGTFVVGTAMLAVSAIIAAVTFTLRTFIKTMVTVTAMTPRVLAFGVAFGKWAMFLGQMVAAIGVAKTGLLLFEHLFGAWGLFISQMIQSAGLAQTAMLLLEHVAAVVAARMASLATAVRPFVSAMASAVRWMLSSKLALRAMEMGALAAGRAVALLRSAMIALEAVGVGGLLAGAAGGAARRGKGLIDTVKTIGLGGTLLLGWRSAISAVGRGLAWLAGKAAGLAAVFAGPWGKVVGLLVAAGALIFGIRSDVQDIQAMTSGGEPLPGAAKNPNVNRSDMRDPMSAPGDGTSSTVGFGRSVGTFNADVANRLGIGPDLSTAAETARNTERTADAAEELVRRTAVAPGASASVPPAANLQSGLAAARATVVPAVPVGWDRQMLSAAERTALAVEGALPVLRAILASSRSTQTAFA